MILVAGDRFLLGIGLEPKVADFWFNQNFDPQLGRPPKNQGEKVNSFSFLTTARIGLRVPIKSLKKVFVKLELLGSYGSTIWPSSQNWPIQNLFGTRYLKFPI